MISRGVERDKMQGTYRDGWGVALYLRSLKRSVRRVQRSRIGSAMLAVIVGLTLTLICQGHDHGSVHMGPHLTFMDSGEHNHTAFAQSVTVDDSATLAEFQETYMSYSMPGMDMTHYFSLSDFTVLQALMPADTSASSSDTVGANLASAVTIPPMENVSLSMLTFTMLLALLWRSQSLEALDVAAVLRRKSQTYFLAEPPPPRAI